MALGASPTDDRSTLPGLGGYNELPVRIHNDGNEAAHGELQIELTGPHGVLASGRVPFDVGPGIAADRRLAHDASAGQRSNRRACPAPRRRVWRTDRHWRRSTCRSGWSASKAIEFAANSLVEQQYLHKAEKSGCADSIRFGSEFGYRFDLRNVRSAQLRINVGANGAKPWNLLVSKDDRKYVLERSGKSWPSWQTVALDKYLAGPREAAASRLREDPGHRLPGP